MNDAQAQADFALSMGDTTLILGHRLSEWTGHAPVLEEELATANVALDLTGQAQLWLTLAGVLDGSGRDADQLAYFRDGPDYRNALLVEQPNGDFAHTLVRQFFFDAWHHLLIEGLVQHPQAGIAEIAGKAIKEIRYHLERSSEWVVRLGDGTPESNARMSAAVARLWPYAGELLEISALASLALDANWRARVEQVLQAATLSMPNDAWAHSGGLHGRHSEHLGKLLAEMQVLQRSYPDAQW